MKKDFYAIVAAAAKKTMPDTQVLNNFSLQELYELSSINKVCGLVYQIVSDWKVENQQEEDLLRSWKEEATQNILREYQKIPLLQRVTELVYRNEIPVIFFKGLILADLYPAIGLRTSGDTDIYVDRKYEQQIRHFLDICGYEQEYKLDQKNVLTYYYREDARNTHKIELHFSLFEDFEGEEIFLLRKMDLTAEEKCVSLVSCGVHTLSMGHTEHLIYQIFHMAKHFVEQGIPMRYMLDVSLFCNHYEEEIDITYFWDCMEQLGYTAFVECCFSICQQYFELSKNFMENRGFETKWLQQAMEEDFLYFGTRRYGEKYAGLFFYYMMGTGNADLQFERERLYGEIKQLGYEEVFLCRIKLLKELGLFQ